MVLALNRHDSSCGYISSAIERIYWSAIPAQADGNGAAAGRDEVSAISTIVYTVPRIFPNYGMHTDKNEAINKIEF